MLPAAPVVNYVATMLAAREYVYNGQAPIGYIEPTRGGFLRAYNYASGCGSGPFTSVESARSYASGNLAEPCNVYCRLSDRPTA